MTHAAGARPIVIERAGGPLFGLLHEPNGPSSGTAVLICPPFGWEEMCSARSRRAWAAELAAGGHPALRIDLPGSADSPGSPTDAGLVSAWLAAITAAAAWLRGATGARRVVAIGIGLGGLLATRATLDGAPVDDLVLWAAPAQGKRVLRELRVFARMEAPLAGAVDPDPLAPGEIAAGGYLLSAETCTALEQLEVSEPSGGSDGGERGERHALLLDRDGLALDPRLAEVLAQAGFAVEQAPGPGFGAMTAEPHDAVAPRAVIERVAGWLERLPIEPRSAAPQPPANVAQLTLAGGVTETALAFAQGSGALFGILSEPAQPHGGPCVVLLNAGAITHAGPNRMWVEAARRWAADGTPVLRLDLTAIGEADGDERVWRDVASFYVPELVDQVLAVLDVLEQRGLGPRFVLGGLCSGAYWSMHAALRDERVIGALMINPRVLIWDPWKLTISDAGRVRAVLRGSTWRKLLRRDPTLTRPSVVVRAALRRALLAPQRLARELRARRAATERGGDALDLALDRLRERGVATTMIFTGDEPVYESFERDGRLARLARWPNLRIVLLSRSPDTHTLRPLGFQRRAHAALDEGLERARSSRGSF